MNVEFRILGPLEAGVDGGVVQLGGPRQRAVLAILLAQANEVVPVERLIDGVWDEEPPDTAANLLQGYVSQLRKLLGKETIHTRGRGYVAVVPDGALDLHRFERHAAAAMTERAEGRPDEAAAEMGHALALWRGPALSDLAELPAIRPIAARLDDLRLTALERRLELDLDGGRHAEAAAELEVLVADHPLRERLRALRMLALYRCGRQADALEAFREARATLVEELGIEPGAELKELEAAILRHDSALAPAAAQAAAPEAAGRRTVVAGALAPTAVQLLAAIGEPLCTQPGRELVLAATAASGEALQELSGRLREARAGLIERGVAARAAAFTSMTPGADLARLAAEQDADLLLVDAPDGLLEDARLLTLLDDAPCDVAVLAGSGPLRDGPLLVPFSGAEHDWAAVELAAWLAQVTGRTVQLAGATTGPGGRDASRLLASASLALQRALGVHADPVLVEPSPEALLGVAGDAGLVLVGMTERWRRDGLGRTRTALATSGGPTLLVRRGLRPGGLAPRAEGTRFTWSIVAA